MFSSTFPLSVSTQHPLELSPCSASQGQDASFFPQHINTTSTVSRPPDTHLTSARPPNSRAAIDYIFVSGC